MEYSAASEEAKLDKAGLQDKESVADKIGKLMDSFQQRLTLDNPRFADRYVKSELHFLVHFFIGGANEEFVACFQRKQIVGGFEERGWKACNEGVIFAEQFSHLSSHIGPEIDATKMRSHGDEQTMLVDDVERVKDPYLVALPSLVWLDTSKRIYRVWPQVLYYSIKLGFVIRGVLSDPEVIVSCGAAGSVRTEKEQLLGNMIQHAPQIVNGVSGDGSNTSWNSFDARHVINQLASLRIVLGANFVGIGVEERPDSTLQVDDVLFGPFNFYLNERNPFVGSHAFSFLPE